MIIPPSQLKKALGSFQGKFLLACLSSGFEPTIVYAAGSQMQLANLYRAMGASKRSGVATADRELRLC